MISNSVKNWLLYYRASLIDASRGRRLDFLEDPIIRKDFQLSSFKEDEIKRITEGLLKYDIYCFKIDNYITDKDSFEAIYKEGKQAEVVKIDKKIENKKPLKLYKIEIAPIYIQPEKEHSETVNEEDTHYPYWIPAYMREDGVLFPPKENDIPIFLREYLAPNPKDSPTIADLDSLDGDNANYLFNKDSWEKYWKDCESYFTKVTDKKYADIQKINKNDPIVKFKICKYRDSSVTKNVINLYNYLVKKEDINYKNTLLEKLLIPSPVEVISDYKNIDIVLPESHYGYMGSEFPLSASQREAFGKYQISSYNDIFAINGPPGTGKTTILQAFIANILVNAVLENLPAPLIIGCSTNNQAITNILDSMKLENKQQNPLQDRWIPNISSFGLYLTTKTDITEYQWTKNFKDGFCLEIDNIGKASENEKYFLDKLFTYAKVEDLNIDPNKIANITQAKNYLRNLIEGYRKSIDNCINITRDRVTINQFLGKYHFSSEEELTIAIDKNENEIAKTNSLLQTLEGYKKDLERRYLSFPFYIKYFSLFGFKKIKENAFKLILKDNLRLYNHIPLHKYFLLQSETDKLLIKKEVELKELIKIQKRLEETKHKVNQIYQNYDNLITKWNKKYGDRLENLIRKTGEEYKNLFLADDMAIRLDISLRNILFWLCVHYREADFIEEQKIRANSFNEDEIDRKRRLAKIVPLFISTFHSLPRFFNYYSYQEGTKYYEQLLDYMIVDEAGQVSPEVAIPSFALTKKLLSVGDIYQIEPIWGIAAPLDYKNMEKYHIVNNDNDFKALSEMGYLSSDGSVMKIALHKCLYNYQTANKTTEKGVLLREHRRCLDGIVTYANQYVYQNSLNLLGGKTHNKKHKLPPLGYLHIDGNCEKYLTSKRNEVEARVLVAWLEGKKTELEQDYGKKLDEIVAIITPYSAQKEYLKELINKHFSREISEKIIIGTVHTLQGAERPIILFSATNTNPSETMFMNYGGKTNMLNVATTRAKHSFIVFANMNIFIKGMSTPSSYLANLLYSSDKNELDNLFVYKKEILFPDKDKNISFSYCCTLEEHRAILKKCFRQAEKELIICSPFVSINAIEEDNITDLIKEAISRTVKVTIITDEKFDIQNGQLKENSKNGREVIQSSGATLLIYPKIHSKTICVDDKIFIVGSFNWLSAVRNEERANKEDSIVLEGDVAKNIDDFKKNIRYNSNK
ncbi:AAA domain-containing protein [Capnocytophaga leadbetteri]|uniref:AAA domain-containing protein n=1 Tax=Capnocytophaga leadbetteri TaxID=327575 RepID=UPI0028E70FBF|nr:AAA domain-containing protein [Capnocytophaga leadbetteri]